MRAVAALLLLCLAGTPAHADDYVPNFRNYHRVDGLPHENVRALAQDRDGYVWVGSQNGLARFDGREFRVFHHQPQQPGSLPDNYVTALAAAPDGSVWVGALAGGLARYDPVLERFESYYLRDPESGKYVCGQVRTLHFDRAGVLWVACFGEGVMQFDPQRRRLVLPPFGRVDALQTTRVIAERADGSLLFGAQGVWRWDRSSRLVVPLPAAGANVAANSPHALLETPDGDLWIGHIDTGLVRLKPDGTLRAQYRMPTLPGDQVRGLALAPDGNVWVVTTRGTAVYRRDADRWLVRPADTSDPTAPGIDGRTILVDRNGLIWIGTSTAGLSVHDPDTGGWRLYRQRQQAASALPHTPVMAALDGGDGSVWIALGEDGGLVQFAFDRGVVRRFAHSATDARGLADEKILALARTRDGSVWLGMETQGVVRLEAGSDRLEHFRHDAADPHSLPVDLIESMLVDADDTLWIGTDGGGVVSRCSGCSEFRTHDLGRHRGESRYADVITAFAPAADGGLWVGTLDGLVHYDPRAQTSTSYRADPTDPQALSHSFVRALYTDDHGTLWIGTAGGGLDRLEQSADGRVRFRAWLGDDAARIDAVHCILGDASGVLWLGTGDGLRRFDPATGHTEPANWLDRNDSAGYRANACLRRGANLLFGGPQGLLEFDPARVPSAHGVGPMRLNELWLYNLPQRPQPDVEGAVLEHSLSHSEHLVFDDRHDVFGFSFAALDFRDPLQLRYRYRVDGLHQDWLPLSEGQRFVSFSGVPAGEYRFRVEAARGSSRSETGIGFTVLPPPWRSPAAYVGYAILLFGTLALVLWRLHARVVYERGVAATIRRSEEALRRLNEELESRVEERTSELKVANTELQATLHRLRATQDQLVEAEKLASLGGLVAGVAHEINTPLGVGITAASHLESTARDVARALAAGDLTRSRLDEFAATAQASAELILRSLERADKLVRSFKQVAVDEAGAERERVDLGECLRDALTALGPSLSRSPHRVELHVEPGLQTTTAPGALHRVIAQLVSNTLLHAYAPGQSGLIRLRLERSGDAALIDYADDGQGLFETVRAHLFEPFFTTKRGQGGTGLGLHIAYNLVTRVLHGSIECRSRPGEGVRFLIRLPLA